MLSLGRRARRARRHAAETGTQLLAGAAHLGKLTEQAASVVDGGGKSVRCLLATLLEVVKDFGQVGFGLVGANDGERNDLQRGTQEIIFLLDWHFSVDKEVYKRFGNRN